MLGRKANSRDISMVYWGLMNGVIVNENFFHIYTDSDLKVGSQIPKYAKAQPSRPLAILDSY